MLMEMQRERPLGRSDNGRTILMLISVKLGVEKLLDLLDRQTCDDPVLRSGI